MTFTYDFLMARAEEAAQDAASAVLDNVRERCLRSEAAWRGMAAQALKVTRQREQTRLERSLTPPA